MINESFNTEKVFGNILSLGMGEVVARMIGLFGIGFLARKLGPEGFGIIGFAIAVFGYLGFAVNAGFNDIGAREVARQPRRASEIAFNVILIRLVLASVIFIILASAIWFFDQRQTIKIIVLLMSLSLFSLALDTSWAYRGLERGQRVGAALILGQTLYVFTLLITVKDKGDIWFVPPAQFFGELCAALFLLVPLYRTKKIKLNIRKGLKIFANSYYWTISRLMRLLNGTFDVVLLGFVANERAVGLYTAPYRLCFALLAISVIVQASYLPVMTRAKLSGLEETGKIAERSINFAASVAAPLIIGGMILAAPILQFAFGSDYVEAAAAFQFLLLSIGLVFLHGAQHNVFLVCDRTKTEMAIFAFAATINVGLNLVIIPRYGIKGAAAVTMLAEAMVLLTGLIVISKIINVRLHFFRAVWRPLAASALMGAALFALGNRLSLFLTVTIGGVCYLLILFFLRGIPPDASAYMHSVVAFANNLRIKFLKT